MSRNTQLRQMMIHEAQCVVEIPNGKSIKIGFTTNDVTGFFLVRFVHQWSTRLGERSGSLFRFYETGEVEYRNWHHSDGEVCVAGHEELMHFKRTPIDPDVDGFDGELQEFVKDVNRFVLAALKAAKVRKTNVQVIK